MERVLMERMPMERALMQLKQPLCCDLTELYAGSLGRGGFYGIARVVAEIALALDGLVEPVQYVVFSASLQRFVRVVLPRQQLLLGRPASFGFAVHRLLFALDQHGSRWLGRCPSALQAWLRRALEWLAAPWLSNPAQAVEPGVLFSAARPKFLARYPRAMQRQGLKLASLVHDFFPLLDTHDRPRQAFVDAFARDNRVVLENSDVVIANSFFTRDCLLQLQHSGQLPQPPKLAVAQLAHECRSPEGGVCTPFAHQHQRALEAAAGGYFFGRWLPAGSQKPAVDSRGVVVAPCPVPSRWRIADPACPGVGGSHSRINPPFCGAAPVWAHSFRHPMGGQPHPGGVGGPVPRGHRHPVAKF